MESSPLLNRKTPIKTTFTSETTPKRRTKSPGSNNRSQLSKSYVVWSSRKPSENKIKSKNEANSYEHIQKELLEYQMTLGNNTSDCQGFTNNLRYSESTDYSCRRSLIKCKLHEEEFNFLSIDDKKFLCTKCLLNKYEKSNQASLKNSVFPIEKCFEYITNENNHFVEVECQQYVRHLQNTISVCTSNNKFLVDKQEALQEIVKNEFNSIFEQLKKREEELLSQINSFFDQNMNENIQRLQNYKFLLDCINKARDHGKHKSFEHNIFQFSFSSKLKKILEHIELSIPKLAQKDIDILGTVSKERIKREIERLGKPLAKSLEMLVTSSKNDTLTKSSSGSISPLRGGIKRDGSLTETHRRTSSVSSRKDQSFARVNRKTSPEYTRREGLENITSSDFTQITISGNQFFEDSTILNSNELRDEAVKLFPININKVKKIYCLTRDGASSQAFHKKCDGLGPYLVVVKTEGKNIFGYYNPLQFISNDKYCGSEHFWVFSLKNYFGRGMIFKIKPEKSFIALYNSSKSPCLGSTIKGKEDLYIDLDNLSVSCSNMGYAYKVWDNKVDGGKILSGKASGWHFDEIEVYQIDQ